MNAVPSTSESGAQGRPAQDRVVLPLGQSRVVSYQHHAFPLSILAATGWSCVDNWLFSHYVQIESPAELKGGFQATEIDFHLTPTHYFHFANSLWILNIRREAFWSTKTQVVPAMMSLLAQGYYLQLTMDDRFIPGSRVFGAEHPVPHESLVHGIDLRAGLAWILGFDAQMQFASRSVPVSSLEHAVWHCDLSGHYDPDGLKLLRAREERWTTKSPHAVLNGLEDYLDSKDATLRRPGLEPVRTDYVYGLAAQDAVARFHEGLSSPLVDIRPSHFLWEHKCLMHQRLRDLEAMGWMTGLASEYESVVREANAIRLLALKLLMIPQSFLGRRIGQRIQAMTLREREILARCRDALASRLRETHPAVASKLRETHPADRSAHEGT